jgi:outer membrane lipoprotein-sorting protein
MKLSQLAAKPQLIKVVLDDEDTKETYGDELEFWIYDRQNMDTFVKLATLEAQEFDKIAGIVNNMILDEEGKVIAQDDMVLPVAVLMKAIQKVVELLGKPQKPTTNNQAEA